MVDEAQIRAIVERVVASMVDGAEAGPSKSSLSVALGVDHGGFELKDHLVKALRSQGFTVVDCGTNSKDSVDYPDFIHPTSAAVEDGACDLGIILCGSGNWKALRRRAIEPSHTADATIIRTRTSSWRTIPRWWKPLTSRR